MVKYGLYFGEISEGAERHDDDETILAEDNGWAHFMSGTVQEILYEIVDLYNGEDNHFTECNDYWMALLRIWDNTVVDGDEVVL